MIDRSDDLLSSVLAVIRLRAEVYHHASLCGDWRLDSPEVRRAAFHILGAGQCRLELLHGGHAVSLRADDLVLLPRNAPHRLSGDEGEAFTTLLCGYFEFGVGGVHLILDALPDLIVLPMAEGSEHAAQLKALCGLVLFEADRVQTGSRLALDRLAEALFVMMMRRYAEQAAEPRGFLAGLTDRQIARALHAMHGTPEQAWRVESLAKVAGMSRTAFAQRFAAVVGQPPLAYLSAWRMLLGERWLAEERLSVAAVAERLGYASETAFRKAFKRSQGRGPGSVRRAAGTAP